MMKDFQAGATVAPVAPFGTYACYACRENVLGPAPSRARRLRALFLVVSAVLAASLLSRPAHAHGMVHVTMGSVASGATW
jgi:hypothetical protein